MNRIDDNNQSNALADDAVRGVDWTNVVCALGFFAVFGYIVYLGHVERMAKIPASASSNQSSAK